MSEKFVEIFKLSNYSYLLSLSLLCSDVAFYLAWGSQDTMKQMNPARSEEFDVLSALPQAAWIFLSGVTDTLFL